MAYKVKQLLDKGLDVSSIDKDLMEDIETIKVLSKDFSKDDSDAMQLDELVYEKLKTSVKQEEATPASTKGKRGRPKGSAKSAPKKKGKRGRPAKQEKAPAKPKMKYKTEPKSDGGVPDCDELLKRWRERRQKAKDMGKKRKTKPVFTKISEGVVSAVEKAIKNVPKADIKAQPVRTVKKFEVLRDAADQFLKAFKSVLGEDYVKTEAEKELSDLEGLISSLQEKYVKKYGDGGMMNAEGDDEDMPVIRTQFEEEDYEYATGGGVGEFNLGQSVIIRSDNDNENYDKYRGKELVITHKATSEKEHRGYDSSMEGQGLYDFFVRKTGETVPFSLYDYEIEQYARGGGVGDKMARGGFVSKGEMVWGKLSNSKKMDFLYKNFTPEITPRGQEILVGRAWNFLPKKVKIKFEAKYADVEEY